MLIERLENVFSNIALRLLRLEANFICKNACTELLNYWDMLYMYNTYKNNVMTNIKLFKNKCEYYK